MKRFTAPLAVLLACMAAAYGLVSSSNTGTPQTAGGTVAPAGWGKPAPFAYGLASPVPTGVMWDSVDLTQIPSNPFAAAGYSGGRWPTYSRIRVLWPKAHAISIAINASEHAECLDVEPGDAYPSQAAAWVRADIKAGYPVPCVYSSWWEFTRQVIPALTAAHISRSSILEWDANYTGVPHIDQGFDGTQWTDHGLGRNLDESLVTLAFLAHAVPPYVAPKPAPAPPPPAPAPAPASRAVCFGHGATPDSATCARVIARHTWLVDRRIFWGREFQRCIRHAEGIGCASSLGWYVLRRDQATALLKRYSA